MIHSPSRETKTLDELRNSSPFIETEEQLDSFIHNNLSLVHISRTYCCYY